jgi:hypothetical protein
MWKWKILPPYHLHTQRISQHLIHRRSLQLLYHRILVIARARTPLSLRTNDIIASVLHLQPLLPWVRPCMIILGICHQ